MTETKPKAERARGQYLLSPDVVERVKVVAARTRTRPNLLVDHLLDIGLRQLEAEPRNHSN